MTSSAPPPDLLTQLRRLADGALPRHQALAATREPAQRVVGGTHETVEYPSSPALRTTLEALRDDVERALQHLEEWENADHAWAVTCARQDAADAAGDVLDDLGQLGAIAAPVRDGRRSTSDVAVERITERVRRRTGAGSDVDTQRLPAIVQETLQATGYVPAGPRGATHGPSQR